MLKGVNNGIKSRYLQLFSNMLNCVQLIVIVRHALSGQINAVNNGPYYYGVVFIDSDQ